jgi:hypothetical protein
MITIRTVPDPQFLKDIVGTRISIHMGGEVLETICTEARNTGFTAKFGNTSRRFLWNQLQHIQTSLAQRYEIKIVPKAEVPIVVLMPDADEGGVTRVEFFIPNNDLPSEIAKSIRNEVRKEFIFTRWDSGIPITGHDQVGRPFKVTKKDGTLVVSSGYEIWGTFPCDAEGIPLQEGC